MCGILLRAVQVANFLPTYLVKWFKLHVVRNSQFWLENGQWPTAILSFESHQKFPASYMVASYNIVAIS